MGEEDKVVKTINIERDENGNFPEGISPGKTHTFRLIAVSDKGESTPVLHRVTMQKVEYKPEIPNITRIEPSETEFVVQWEGPNEHVTKYQVVVLNEDKKIIKELQLEKRSDESFPNQVKIDLL